MQCNISIHRHYLFEVSVLTLTKNVGFSREALFAAANGSVVVDLADGVHAAQSRARVYTAFLAANKAWIVTIGADLALGFDYDGGRGRTEGRTKRAVHQRVGERVTVGALAMRSVADDLALRAHAARSGADVYTLEVVTRQVIRASAIISALRLASLGRERVALMAGQAGADRLVGDVVNSAVGVGSAVCL